MGWLSYANKFGSYGGGNNQFYFPIDVCADASYLYVVDGSGQAVKKYGKASPFTYAAKTPDFQMYSPRGVAVDDQWVYVADYYVICTFNKGFLSPASTFGSGHFLSIDVDANYVYAYEMNANKVNIYNKTYPYALVGQFTPVDVIAYYLHVDGSYIYVADSAHRVRIFNKTAPYALVGQFGSLGEGNGQFHFPYGIFVHTDYIYVADSGNTRVQVFNKTAPYAFVTKFGSLGSGNGQFTGNAPQGLHCDANFVYVADGEDYRIQLFDNSPPLPVAPSNLILACGVG